MEGAPQVGTSPDNNENHRPKTWDEIKNTIIDPEGVFKYIQINVHNSKSDLTRMVVRGYKSCDYHADILAKFEHEELMDYDKSNGELTCSCPGGGRIEHKPQEASILIYGHSKGFGLAEHQLTQNLLEMDFKGYNISWNNDGY